VLFFGRVRRFHHLIRGAKLPVEYEGKVFLVATPPHFYCNALARLMVAEPAFRRTLQRLPVKGQQNIAILHARLLSCASGFQGADRRRGVPSRRIAKPNAAWRWPVSLSNQPRVPARSSNGISSVRKRNAQKIF